MPTIFDDPHIGPQITRTRCPPFDGDAVKRACDAQTTALTARHEQQIGGARQALRTSVARQHLTRCWEPSWPLTPSQRLFSADQAAFPREVADEVAALRQTLPAELAACVEEAGLAVENKLVLARRSGATVPDYELAVGEATRESLVLRQLEQQCRTEQLLLRERLDAAIKRWRVAADRASSPGSGGSSSFLSFTPATTFNVVDDQPRYFRILVWNLENFTRDRRPRGAQPMDSMRNQTRVAIIADVLARLHIDLLLIMETGTDVGTATTRIARRTGQKLREEDGRWEPLVSPSTGALPEVALSYPDVQLGRPSGLKALALRTLFHAYLVTPCHATAPADVTALQIAGAWSALRQASPEAKRRLPPLAPTDAIDHGFPHGRVLGSLVVRLGESAMRVAEQVRGQLGTDVDVVYNVTHTLVNELLSDGLQTEPDTIAYAILSARDARMALADVSPASEDDQVVVETGIACLQGIELMLLFVLKAQATRIPTAGLAGRVFRSDSSEDGVVPLAAFLCAGAQHVNLRAHDRKLGPANGDLDNDVLLDALQRIGAVVRHIETYGVVYRQPRAGALDALIRHGVLSHGFSGGVDEEAARYGIVRAPLSRVPGFTIQEAGGILNWRSAMQITVPVSGAVSLPLVVYHTRYSGTAEIKRMDEELTAEQNTVLARCMSVWMMAGAVLPGHTELGPPLLVGDFNVPDAFLNAQAPVTRKDKRMIAAAEKRLALRTRFFQEMASRGYLRHSTGGAVDTGYPRTTLKAYSSIMAGDGILSETYDGTYQPFGYAGGRVGLESGIVGIDALLVDAVLGEEVTGIPSQATDGDVIDPDAGGDGDGGDEDGADVDEDEPAEPPQAKWTVRDAIAVEVGRVYRSLIRRIWQPIEELVGFIERQMKGVPADLAKLLVEIKAQHAAHDAGAMERVKWFVVACGAGGVQTCAAATGKDWLIGWRDLLLNAAASADRHNLRTHFELQSQRFRTTVDDVMAVHAQLTVLETRPDVRRVIAYRAVVSDHLPQIIEVDLQPV